MTNTSNVTLTNINLSNNKDDGLPVHDPGSECVLHDYLHSDAHLQPDRTECKEDNVI